MAAERTTAPQPRRLSTATKRKLRQPLAPEHISEREGDEGTVRYLEGWRAIQLANAIFGEDRWGAEVVGEVTYRPILQTGRRNATPVLGIYTATVRVTVDDCPSHSDVGAAAVEEQTPEHHATAYKAAVTDGLKRALRHYGAGFGNELSARLDGTDDTCPDVDAEPLRREVIAIAERAGSDEARTREWVAEKYGCALDDLDARRLQDAVTRLGDGAAIKIMDSSHISNYKLVQHFRQLARENDIPHQMEILPRGGTDAGAMVISRSGAPVITLSFPTRYVHTVNEMCSIADIQAGVRLLATFIEHAHEGVYTLG